jgi:integrase
MTAANATMSTHDKIEAFLEHIAHGITPGSLGCYRRNMDQFEEFFLARDPASFGVPDIAAFITWLATIRHNKPQFIRYKMLTVKRFFVWLADQQLLPDEKIDIFIARRLPKLVNIPHPKHAITEEEHRHILNRVSRGRHKRWWVTGILIAWHTGLRISDIATLKWEQIDWEEELLSAVPIKTRRLGKSVTIPMDEELVEHLSNLRREPYYPSPFVIPDMAGYYTLPGDLLGKQFKYLCLTAGHPKLHIHGYRHAFVSRMINAGVDPIIISSMTAQSLQQIASYAHVSDEAKRDALAKARAAMHRAKLRQRGIAPTPVIYEAEPVAA